MLLTFFITDGSKGRDFSHFSWPNYILHLLPSYLFDWIDIIGDVNFGFRAIAVTELGARRHSFFYAADNSYRHLKTHFCSSISLWNILYGIQPPQGNNPFHATEPWSSHAFCTTQPRLGHILFFIFLNF